MSTHDKGKRRCIVIGIDGATFKIIQPLIDDGKLPNIANLISNGVHGNLKSGIPRVSPSIWTSIITGKNPGKHNVYDFIQNEFSNTGFIFNSSANRKAKPLWSVLSDYEKKVCVAGLLMTYPPDKVNGYMVSQIIMDLLGSSDRAKDISYTYPKELSDEIETQVGEFVISRKKRTIQNVYHDLLKSAEYHSKIYNYLSRKNGFDFEFYYFPETDLISHLAWKYLNKKNHELSSIIHGVYEKIDTCIGNLVSREKMNVILISDHGFSELKRTVSLSRTLENMGLFKYKKNHLIIKLRRNLGSILILIKNLILNRREPLQGFNYKLYFSSINWKSTMAYPLGTSCGTIFINLKDRESKGIVESTEYDKICREIIHNLEKIVDRKTGQKVVKKVYRREDIFSGPYMKNAPDLYIDFEDGYGVSMKKDVRYSKGDGITDAKAWKGDHDENGIFIASGPSFKKGCTIENASIMDITPTVLYLMGVPISKDMDGKILMDAIDDEFAAQNIASYIDSDDYENGQQSDIYTEEDNEQIAKRLKDLGYL